MRALGIALVVVGLALDGGVALAQVPQAVLPARTLQQSRPSLQLQMALSAQQPQPSLPSQTALSTQQPQPSLPSQTAQPSRPAQPAQAGQRAQPRYSADGLYNLANAYARAGKAGLAVLNYERAALLAPGDADINANLEFVRASAHVSTQPRSRLARVAQAVSPSIAAWIGVLGIALVGVGLLATRVTHRFRRTWGGSIALGVAMITLSVSSAVLLWPRMREAVVLVNQTPARVSPVPMGDPAFVLPEAETVTVTAVHEDFVLIRTHGGLTGWVARASLGTVIP